MADSVVLRLDSGPLVPAVTFVCDDREVGLTVFGTEVTAAEADQIRQQAARAHLTLAEGYVNSDQQRTDVPADVANAESEPVAVEDVPSPVVPDPEFTPTGAANEHFESMPMSAPEQAPQADEQSDQSPDTETTEQADQGGEPDSNA